MTDIQPMVATSTLNGVQAVLERDPTMPKVSMAKIEGRTRGRGSEFARSPDMAKCLEIGGQTPEGELDRDRRLGQLGA